MAESAEEEKVRLDRLTREIIGAAIRIHRAVGPGLYETAYAAFLAHELTRRGLRYEREKPIPVEYDGIRIPLGYRLDFLVEEAIVVELKAIERFAPVHDSQLRSYLVLSGMKVGLLINFRSDTLIRGIRRMVNGYPD